MNDIIKYKEYYAVVHFSMEDEIFFGKILGINDLVTFEGQSVKELKKSFKEAIQDYLETCEKLKKNPDKSYRGTFNIRISPDLHRTAVLVASQKNITLNDFVKTAINYAIQHKDDIDPQMAS